MQRFSTRRLGVAGLLLGVILAVSLLAPLLATHDPRHAVPEEQLQAPSYDHFLGTDLLGRDVYSRVVFGGRRVLVIAGLTLVITAPVGLLIGVLAGFVGRWLDTALMTLVDALLAFPNLLLALALVTLFGDGIMQIGVAVGVAAIPAYARVTRAAVLEARARPFVEGARALGASPLAVVWRHIVPTIMPPLLAFTSVTLSWAILNGAALAFIGYAGDICATDWGIMLADGRATFRTAPWIACAPGVALSTLIFALNLLGNGLSSGRT